MAKISQSLVTPSEIDQTLTNAERALEAGRLEEAEKLCQTVLAKRLDDAQAAGLLGRVAFQRGDITRATMLLERAVAVRPSSAVLTNLCEMYRLAGAFDRAVAAGERAVALDARSGTAHCNLGLACFERGEIDRSIVCLLRAITIEPALASAHLGLAHSLLIRGELRPGWLEYEWRYKVARYSTVLPKINRPQWNGMRIAGRLLVIGDQGFGDCIQFSRYFPLAAARCSSLVLACAGEIIELLGAVPGVAASFDRWENVGDFAAYCPLTSLPGIFGTELDSIPATVPYLAAKPARIEHWRWVFADRLPVDSLRVGLVWAGRPTHGNDVRRSLSLAALEPLADSAGVAFVGLQKGPAATQVEHFGDGRILALSDELTSFAETAAVVANLDLVIAVDTAVAHLAAALGKPVWMMLPWLPDWRWLLDRDDTPWYPTMRLFRQPRPGDWRSVVARVASELGAVGRGDRQKLLPRRVAP
jgi:Flp pilus assembly protein TadD